VPTLVAWEGSRLTLVGLDALTIYKRVVAWFPGPAEDAERYLLRLRRLEQGLNTKQWRVYERREVSNGVRLVLSIDAASVSVLERLRWGPFSGSLACYSLPDSAAVEGGVAPAAACRATRVDWRVAARIITYRRVEWVIDLFAPYTSPGMDGIFPAFLQEGWVILIPYLVRIFRACLAIGYVPALWRLVRCCLYLSPVGVPSVDPGILDPSFSHRSY